ncbi:hypothetical protein ABDC18_002876 [Escherichia coli]
MANINKDVDFIDNDGDGELIKNDIGSMSEAEKEHMITDIIHKLFVIASFHNHHKALKDVEKRLNEKPKAKVIKGALI